MPSLKSTKKRITSVKSTQKITNAMQLVAASKFSKSLEKRSHGRQYAAHLDSLLRRCMQEASATSLYPYVLPGYGGASHAGDMTGVEAPSNKALLVVITSDRGLCGSLNAQVLKQARHVLMGAAASSADPADPAAMAPPALGVLGEAVVRDLMDRGYAHHHNGAPATSAWELMLWGKKSWGLEQSFAALPAAERPHIFLKDSFTDSTFADSKLQDLKDLFVENFCVGRWQKVVVVRAQFESALVQHAGYEQLLPLPLEQIFASADTAAAGAEAMIGSLWEPEASELLKLIIDKKLEVMLRQAILDAQVCEHAARMTAMDSATQNAGEVIKNLTLEYNRARQAAITTELVEITSGAEALVSS